MPGDQDFLARLRRHEEAAFAEFFEAYADRVYRLAMGLLKQADDAEEVVQATFLSAFEALDRFEPQAQLSTWLYRIAYNHALMLLRRRHAVASLPEEDEDATPFPVHIQELTEAACKVRLHRARLRLREQVSPYFSERSQAPTEETR
jgi:RNA polymerase sigma-70 factor (ECF subfamily)